MKFITFTALNLRHTGRTAAWDRNEPWEKKKASHARVSRAFMLLCYTHTHTNTQTHTHTHTHKHTHTLAGL